MRETHQRFHHGGELKNKNHSIKYDFSVNINPLGLPRAAAEALQAHPECFTRYPDPECSRLRETIAAVRQVRPEQVVCGSGASDLIYRICSALKFRTALLPVPSFTEYERALHLNGCRTEFLQTKEADDYALTEEVFLQWAEKEAKRPAYSRADAVILCNPGNPSGKLMTRETLHAVADWCSRNRAVLVVDECFLGFSEAGSALSMAGLLSRTSVQAGMSAGTQHPAEMSAQTPHPAGEAASMNPGSAGGSAAPEAEIIVLDAFTKLYAMAGLRAGYALCSSPETAERILAAGPPWNVSGPAQIAAAAALTDTEYADRTRKLVSAERTYMEHRIRLIMDGYQVFSSDVNYILFTGPPELAEAMAEEGVAIRDCSDYLGLGYNYYRTAVSVREENDAMLEALRRCMKWL